VCGDMGWFLIAMVVVRVLLSLACPSADPGCLLHAITYAPLHPLPPPWLSLSSLHHACMSARAPVHVKLYVSVGSLVQLLRTGTAGGQMQAAGALRSMCINSARNKAELNRVGGIAALVSAGIRMHACCTDVVAYTEIHGSRANVLGIIRRVGRRTGGAGYSSVGRSWQVQCIRKGLPRACEQAGAALANACANSVANQVS